MQTLSGKNYSYSCIALFRGAASDIAHKNLKHYENQCISLYIFGTLFFNEHEMTMYKL